MTHTSPTALELYAIRERQRGSYNTDAEYDYENFVQARADRQFLLNHIAALEAELAQATRERDEWETQSENQCRDRERYRDVLVMLCAAPPEITRKAMASVAYDTVFNLIPKDVAEFQLVERSKAEAQLATRLPDREAIAAKLREWADTGESFEMKARWLHEWLLSGAATPAPTLQENTAHHGAAAGIGVEPGSLSPVAPAPTAGEVTEEPEEFYDDTQDLMDRDMG